MLQFTSSASSVLLIQSEVVFRRLLPVFQRRNAGVIVVTGCGIPRLCVRRLVHRFRAELGLPVWVLADLGPWGYFIYSVLVRGCIGPHMQLRPLGVSDAKYLGLRACEHFGDLCCWSVPLRKWEKQWTARVGALRDLPPFAKSRTWKREFDTFCTNRHGASLVEVLDVVGEDLFFDHMFVGRIPGCRGH